MTPNPTVALEQEIRRLPRIGRAPYLPTIKKWLAAGADPNSPARSGSKSIMVMVLDQDFPLTPKHRWELLPLLIAHGGNPFLESQHFLGMIRNYSAFIDTLKTSMVEYETKGGPLVGVDNGNLCHLMLGDDDGVRTLPWVMGKTACTFPHSWLSAVNDRGQTPLHVLWKELNSDNLVVAWELTQDMTNWGVCLDSVDDSGLSVRDAITNRLATVDLTLLQDEHPDTKAAIEGWLLGQTTQKIEASGPGRRL